MGNPYYPGQADYGGDRQLVPKALRLYRHYRLDANRGLTPTAISASPTVAPGWNQAECQASERERADRKCELCLGRGAVTRATPFQIDLSPGDGLAVSFDYDPWNQVRTPCECLDNHEAPSASCRCGFYASYSPRTNFFREYINSASLQQAHHFRTSGGPIHQSAYAPAYAPVPTSLDVPPVFAVVEASGRVLMGSSGVRAEKMRVVAAVIDSEHAALARNKCGSMTQLLSTLDYMKHVYGFQAFGFDIPAMVRAYPQPDLSELIEHQDLPEPDLQGWPYID